MAETRKNIINKKLHVQAEKAVLQYTDDFSKSLTTQARFIAYNSKADIVLSNHVREAWETINNGAQKKNSLRDLGRDLGGILLGLSFEGYRSEINSGNINVPTVNIYLILFAIGLTLFLLGHLWRR